MYERKKEYEIDENGNQRGMLFVVQTGKRKLNIYFMIRIQEKTLKFHKTLKKKNLDIL